MQRSPILGAVLIIAGLAMAGYSLFGLYLGGPKLRNMVPEIIIIAGALVAVLGINLVMAQRGK